jgi:hypothetical protein
MSPVDLNRGCSSSNILVFFKSNLVASWVDLLNCGYFRNTWQCWCRVWEHLA